MTSGAFKAADFKVCAGMEQSVRPLTSTGRGMFTMICMFTRTVQISVVSGMELMDGDAESSSEEEEEVVETKEETKVPLLPLPERTLAY